MKWEDVLGKIRRAEEPIPVDEKTGLPTIAKGLMLCELLQLLEATTTGHNMQIRRVKKLEAENARLKRALAKAFPNGGK